MEHLIKCILEQKNLDYTQKVKSKNGFTNIVYFVDSMVIKIALEEEGKKITFADIQLNNEVMRVIEKSSLFLSTQIPP